MAAKLQKQTYAYQTYKPRYWVAPITWPSQIGECLAVRENQNGTYSVLVRPHEPETYKVHWYPEHDALTPGEIWDWVYMCNEIFGEESLTITKSGSALPSGGADCGSAANSQVWRSREEQD